MMEFIFSLVFMFFMIKKVVLFYNVLFFYSFLLMFKVLYKDKIWLNISYLFGVEFFSYYLIILSVWVLGMMFLSVDFNKSNLFLVKKKIIIFLLMLIILLLFFMSMNLIIFYLMFEMSLVPIFMLIIYWGMNFERMSAAYYLLMYTMLVSMPLFVYIMSLFNLNSSFDFNVLLLKMKMSLGFWDYLLFFMAFYIKMPMFLFHLWLPKAHVEAPVYGSMLLAAILLKLGSYGMLRFMELFLESGLKYNYIIFSISLVGSLFVSLLSLLQIDMKSLVAYSSVVHMNMLMCSLLTLMKSGFISAYFLMVSHGLCSSGLFYMVNLYYQRSFSRVLFFNKGMMNIFPSLSVWWLMLCAANFSFPFFLSFFSEMILISVLVSWEIMMIILIFLICFFSSSYSLYLYSYVQHGKVNFEGKFFVMSVKEYLVLYLHVMPLIFLIFNMMMFN